MFLCITESESEMKMFKFVKLNRVDSNLNDTKNLITIPTNFLPSVRRKHGRMHNASGTKKEFFGLCKRLMISESGRSHQGARSGSR